MRIWDVEPETRRWEGKPWTVGISTRVDAGPGAATGAPVQDAFVDSPDRQPEILLAKPCDCPLDSGGRA